ncbi:FtsB family cell division protein [Enorma sp.]
MRYAADNRIVQAVYQFTTGSTRYLFYGLVVLAVGIGLYFPVRDLYTAYRTGDILERQLEVRNDYNEVLEDKVSRLLSTEGIEDIARENLGLVMPGERVVTVTGVEADESSSGDSLTASEVENAELAVVDDAPWYIKVLDAIFFYRGVEGQVVSSAGEAESEEAASGASSEGETQAEEPSSEE